jgi:hypothetical protein
LGSQHWQRDIDIYRFPHPSIKACSLKDNNLQNYSARNVNKLWH